jgi:hypothetical protein
MRRLSSIPSIMLVHSFFCVASFLCDACNILHKSAGGSCTCDGLLLGSACGLRPILPKIPALMLRLFLFWAEALELSDWSLYSGDGGHSSVLLPAVEPLSSSVG